MESDPFREGKVNLLLYSGKSAVSYCMCMEHLLFIHAILSRMFAKSFNLMMARSHVPDMSCTFLLLKAGFSSMTNCYFLPRNTL